MFSDNKYRTYTISIVHLLLYGISIFHSLNENELSLKYVFFIFLVLVNFLSMTNISFTNPGFICKKFKNRNREETINFQHKIEIKKYFTNKWHLSIKIGEEEFVYNYCEECNIFKMKGISHCRECDCCVQEMDHHCFWFRTCIARNNIRHFYLYLYSATILFYFGTSSLKHISDLVYDKENILRRFFYCILSFLTLSFFTIFILIFAFSIYYFYLALTNINSREFIKNIKRYRKIDLTSFIKRIFVEQRKISCEQVHNSNN